MPMWMHAGQDPDLRNYFSQVKAAMLELQISIDKFDEQMKNHLRPGLFAALLGGLSLGMKGIRFLLRLMA